MPTWADDRATVADVRPRRWLAGDAFPPDYTDLAEATEARVSTTLHWLGWPVIPCRPGWCQCESELGPWTGGTHWP